MDDDNPFPSIILNFLPSNLLSPEVLTALVVILILLAAAALISASEVAFFGMKPRDLEAARKEATPFTEKLLDLLAQPHYLLATILISLNFVNIGIVLVSDFMIDKILGEQVIGQWERFFFEVILVTFFLVLFGEIMPKIYANSNKAVIANIMASPLIFIRKICYPISFLLVSSSKFIEQYIGESDNQRAVSTEELDQAIELTVQDTEHNTQDKSLLKSIIKFGSVPVCQIMQSRTDIVAVDQEDDFLAIMKTIRESGYSRLPVTQDNSDHIIGILFAKDLLPYIDEGADFYWQRLVKSPFFVPESKKIDDLLKEFQAKRVHLAVVVDEYGGTAGIVTLEDIMEEVIGDIRDEFDDIAEINYKKIDDKNYSFDGKTMLNDACKIISVDVDVFETARGDADSLAGLLLELKGRMPKQNEVIHYKNYSFKVLAIDSRRIKQIQVTLP